MDRFNDRRRTFPKSMALISRSFQICLDELSDGILETQVVLLVESMITLTQRLDEVRTEFDRTIIQRQIDATDRQIDRLVYTLYELIDEEIAIVESAN